MAAHRIPLETRILTALRRRPLMRTQLSERLQLYPVSRMDAALQPMIEAGQVATEKRKGARGKPATVYRLAANPETRPPEPQWRPAIHQPPAKPTRPASGNTETRP